MKCTILSKCGNHIPSSPSMEKEKRLDEVIKTIQPTKKNVNLYLPTNQSFIVTIAKQLLNFFLV